MHVNANAFCISLQALEKRVQFIKNVVDNFRSCIELPSEILHPFHSSHLLTLLAKPPAGFSEFFVCEERGDLSSGFAFHCNICEFNLDVECAVLSQRPKGSTETRTDSYHFSHHHDLMNFNAREELKIKCSACELPLSGPAFGCLNCKFFLHRSCEEMPREIRHQYHPPHLLYAELGGHGSGCNTCDYEIGDIFYGCSECNFQLHIQCAKNGLGIRSAPKHKCHKHELYSFVSSESNEYSYCEVCGKKCNGPCYTCINCSCTYFHPQCIPLPQTVEHESHFHPLTLVDSFLEDDSGEYYCDTYEKERNPIYPVYCCKECPDYIPFIAHIECFGVRDVELDPGNASSSVLVVQPVKHNEEQLGDTKYPAFVEFDEDEAIAKPHCKKQIECDLNLHLKCIPIPLKVKQECHIYPLLLYENLVEGDSGEYYCDICEKPRNPNHDVYYCEECEVAIAHIGCVIQEGDTALEALLWWSDDDPGSDIAETSGQMDPGIVLGSTDGSGSESEQDWDVGDSELVNEVSDSEQNNDTMKESNAEVEQYHIIVKPDEEIKDLREEMSKLATE
ncbi:unnamed protein product [Dovyalis caffra]|uniref:DC1 domain-containing protein n=1 Tax=Dovyalis caffra TaxID=77055 RepID=A0AAV1RZN2_9ROSI|nr:unnamed protein product [Dovyalis caffra]